MQKVDYGFTELIQVCKSGDFNIFLNFLKSHGGLDGISEFGRTALMHFMSQEHKKMSEFAGTEYVDYENDYAKKLIELGADINLKDRKGYTALQLALAAKNVEMVEYLLNCEKIDFTNISLQMEYCSGGDVEDSIMASFVEHGYNIFSNQEHLPIFSFDNLLNYHTGTEEFIKFSIINNMNWYEYEKTLTAISKMYPEKLPVIPKHYLKTIEYDFIANEFLVPYPSIYSSKKRLQDFIKILPKGKDSVDEYGRNLLSICYARLRFATLNVSSCSKSFAKFYVSEKKNFEKAITQLENMGFSNNIVDRFGKTTSDYKKELEMKS